MRKLARIFGFDRGSAADAAVSKRKRNVRENFQTSFLKRRSKKNFTNSDLAGSGMGGASKKLNDIMNQVMTGERERPDSAFARVTMRGQPKASADEVPRPTESGVFVTSPRSIDAMTIDAPLQKIVDARAIEEVTLIVYGWENVQPGTLSWVFPSLRAALAAVRAMRNAVRWAVLHGIVHDDHDAARDVESAREHGLVLVEAS
jgi:hypothetical protein